MLLEDFRAASVKYYILKYAVYSKHFFFIGTEPRFVRHSDPGKHYIST